jgi:hypothetical protein
MKSTCNFKAGNQLCIAVSIAIIVFAATLQRREQFALAFSQQKSNRPIRCLKGSASSPLNPSSSSSSQLWVANSNETAETTTTSTKRHTKSSNKNAKHKKSKKYNPNNSKNYKFNKKNTMGFNAAKLFNSQLTKCNTVSELLTSFMEQTSSKGGALDNGKGGSEGPEALATSSATHLAGAQKVNSVNFSTCLHRLARFASSNSNLYNSNNNSNEGDERKQVLSDPRFAMLVCSMAEMAADCNPGLTVGEGKALVDQWKVEDALLDSNLDLGVEMEMADDVLSDIVGMSSDDGGYKTKKSNDSTNSVLQGGNNIGERKAALANKIMKQLAAPTRKNVFSSRECSNVCWALAKLRMAPPSHAFALGRVVDAEDSNSEERNFSSVAEMSLDVLSSSLQVRMQLLEEARKRRMGGENAGGGSAWIPELSRLAGKVLDLIAVQIIQEYGSRNNNADDDNIDESNRKAAVFNPQEMASVLWAFAKAKRADDALFSAVAEELMRQTAYELKSGGGQGPKPQELSNTIWAFATAGIRGDTQVSTGAVVLFDTFST